MNGLRDLQIRTMRREDLAFAIDLAGREGWNPGLHDADCFYSADPDGFLIAELQGEPIGCISAVSYGGRFGFVGLYIVRPQFRGQGWGLRLWQNAKERLQGHNIGLDGVVAQQGNYARSGFRLAYRNIRHRGRAVSSSLHPSIQPVSKIPFPIVADFDRRIFPASREPFLRAWLTQPKAVALGAMDRDRLTGYTVIRPCRQGWKIGPLAADNDTVARRLFEGAIAQVPVGEDIFLDVPEANPAARALVTEFNLSPVFETARMYTGPDPEVELSALFGVTTFELG